MGFLIYLLNLAVDIYIGIIIIQIVIHWLVAFDVLKTHSPQAQNLMALMHRLTDPVYRPLRRFIPPIGGLDLTPIVVIIGLNVARGLVIGALI